MKRKTYNKISVPTFRKTGTWIRINPKNGAINFSQEIAAKLDLKNQGVNFIQDEENQQDWYIETSQDENAFTVRIIAGKITLVQSTTLARAILKSLELEPVTTRFNVSTEPVEENLYAIITKSAKSKIRKAA